VTVIKRRFTSFKSHVSSKSPQHPNTDDYGIFHATTRSFLPLIVRSRVWFGVYRTGISLESCSYLPDGFDRLFVDRSRHPKKV
jgi:hypothetical protein